jgi:hypothetical protein
MTEKNIEEEVLKLVEKNSWYEYRSWGDIPEIFQLLMPRNGCKWSFKIGDHWVSLQNYSWHYEVEYFTIQPKEALPWGATTLKEILKKAMINKLKG